MLTRLLNGELRSRGASVAEVIYGANDGIVTMFAVVVGASRTFVSHRSWLRSGGEMLRLWLLAAGVASSVGAFLSGVA